MLRSMRFYSSRGPSRAATRFPTKFNPVRSAYKNEIKLPAGLVYNPAPSAPNPMITPDAFIPETDTRAFRKDTELFDVENMPPVSPSPLRTYHLQESEVLEMQRLREEEPEKWTRKALAEKFGVSGRTVGMLTQPNEVRALEMQSRLATIKSMWNDKRARARDQNLRRKNFWLRDA